MPGAAPPPSRALMRVSKAAADRRPLVLFGRPWNQSRTPGPSASGSRSWRSPGSFFSTADTPIFRLSPVVMPRMCVGPPTISSGRLLGVGLTHSKQVDLSVGLRLGHAGGDGRRDLMGVAVQALVDDDCAH